MGRVDGGRGKAREVVEGVVWTNGGWGMYTRSGGAFGQLGRC